MTQLCTIALIAATVVPVEIYERLMLVPVQVDGVKRIFVLHTGAPHSYVDERLRVKASTLRIGRESLKVNLTPIDLTGFETAEGRRVDGILGGELFAAYAVEMDSDASVIRLHPAGAYRYSGTGASVPVTMKKSKPYIAARLKLRGHDEETREYLVDTGSADAIADDRFKEAGGPLVGPDLTRAEAISLGPFRFEGVNGTSGGPNIGGELLHRFHVIADFAHARLILEPNRFYHDAFLFDTSGLDMQMHPRGFVIVKIFDKTPASEAQLREDDVIVAIDGCPAGALGLVRVRLMFHQIRDHDLRIERDGTPMTIAVHLRRLL